MIKKNYIKIFKKSSSILAISLLLNFILFSIFFIFVTPKFDTNDDIAMMDIASGLRTGEPSEYLVYINILIGKIFVALYSWSSVINWYPFLFYLIHFTAMSAICFCILKNTRNIYGFILYALIFSFFEIYFLSNLQFTTTALLSGFSGVFLYLTHNDEKNKRYYVAIIISILLILTGALIRKETFFLVMGVSLILFIFKFLEKPSWKIPVYLVIVVILFSSFYLIDKTYYQKDSDWAFYMEYNKLRARIADYPYFDYDESNKEIYANIGWGKNEVDMIRSFFFPDMKVFSKENLQYIVSNIKPKTGLEEILQNLLRSLLKVDTNIKWFTSFFIIISILISRSRKNLRIFIAIFTTLLVMLYLSYYGRSPNHVTVPIIFFICLAITYYVSQRDGESNYKIFSYKWGKIILLSFALLIISFSYFDSYKSTQINKIEHKKYEAVTAEMKDENKVFITWGSTFYYDKKVVFFNRKEKTGYKRIGTGWDTFSPHYFKLLDDCKIENLFLSLINREDIFLHCGEGNVNALNIFMEKYYNKSIEAVSVFESELDYQGTHIYKIKEKK